MSGLLALPAPRTDHLVEFDAVPTSHVSLEVSVFLLLLLVGAVSCAIYRFEETDV